MKLIIACVLLMIAPTSAIIIFKQYREFQEVERQEEAQEQRLATGEGEVLFFNATWCGPCRQMKPIVTEMRRQGYRMRDVDVDRNRALAQKYKVSSIPTFVFLQHGREVKRFSGGTSSKKLHQLCSSPVYR